MKDRIQKKKWNVEINIKLSYKSGGSNEVITNKDKKVKKEIKKS